MEKRRKVKPGDLVILPEFEKKTVLSTFQIQDVSSDGNYASMDSLFSGHTRSIHLNQDSYQPLADFDASLARQLEAIDQPDTPVGIVVDQDGTEIIKGKRTREERDMPVMQPFDSTDWGEEDSIPVELETGEKYLVPRSSVFIRFSALPPTEIIGLLVSIGALDITDIGRLSQAAVKGDIKRFLESDSLWRTLLQKEFPGVYLHWYPPFPDEVTTLLDTFTKEEERKRRVYTKKLVEWCWKLRKNGLNEEIASLQPVKFNTTKKPPSVVRAFQSGAFYFMVIQGLRKRKFDDKPVYRLLKLDSAYPDVIDQTTASDAWMLRTNEYFQDVAYDTNGFVVLYLTKERNGKLYHRVKYVNCAYDQPRTYNLLKEEIQEDNHFLYVRISPAHLLVQVLDKENQGHVYYFDRKSLDQFSEAKQYNPMPIETIPKLKQFFVVSTLKEDSSLIGYDQQQFSSLVPLNILEYNQNNKNFYRANRVEPFDEIKHPKLEEFVSMSRMDPQIFLFDSTEFIKDIFSQLGKNTNGMFYATPKQPEAYVLGTYIAVDYKPVEETYPLDVLISPRGFAYIYVPNSSFVYEIAPSDNFQLVSRPICNYCTQQAVVKCKNCPKVLLCAAHVDTHPSSICPFIK